MHLCLGMIVRNEAVILPRCLGALKDAVQSYIIVDTGSTDGTPNKIRELLPDLPGEIHQAPFIDFSQARNAQLDAANASPIPWTHLLLCDADMVLCADSLAPWPELWGAIDPSRPAYLVQQRSGTSYYDNTRILRRGNGARYVGKTHEYLSIPGPAPTRLPIVHFHDHADGASRPEKHTRDARLLEETLREHPNDARTRYYLGQTYRELGLPAVARKHYEARTKLGGFEEEAWHAQFRVAECFAEEGDEAQAIAAALTAYQRRPTRKEPLHWLARYFRFRGKNDLAVLFARAGLGEPIPENDQLFVEPFVYTHGFREELSIAGYYVPRERKAAAAITQDLAVDRAAPEHIRQIARNNLMHYAPVLAEWNSAVRHTRLSSSSSINETVTNPSIFYDAAARELWVNLRAVNYRIDERGHYTIKPGDGTTVRTKNELVQLDASGSFNANRSFNVIRQQEIIDRCGEGTVPDARIQGYEDIRLLRRTADGFLASAAVLDRAPVDHPQMVLLRIRHVIVENQAAWYVTRVQMLASPEPELPQKNWMPLLGECESGEYGYASDPVLWIYRTEPFQYVQYALEAYEGTPSGEIIKKGPPVPEPGPWALEHARGSSQAIPWTDETSLAVVHEVVMQGSRRHYLHRFVVFGKNGPVAITDAFRFHGDPIEFCAGLAQIDERLILSYGRNDAEAWLAEIPASVVRGQLRSRA